MKKFEAIIRPAAVDVAVEALVRIGVRGMTLTRVRGFGRQRGQCEIYRGSSLVVNLLPKVKLEMFVLDEQVEEIIGTLRAAACTGRIGDGKIFISAAEEVVHIRTGKRGEEVV